MMERFKDCSELNFFLEYVQIPDDDFFDLMHKITLTVLVSLFCNRPNNMDYFKDEVAKFGMNALFGHKVYLEI